MNIFFRTRKLEKVCNKRAIMLKELGDKMSKKLQQRLSELLAAESLADISHLPPPRLHELTGNRKGQYSVDLVHPYRLIFIAANEKEDYISKEDIREIEIIEIIDTH